MIPQEDQKILHQKILGLRNRDPLVRKECADHIPKICAALGPERTIGEFILYLTTTTGNTEDQWVSVVLNLGKIDFNDYGSNEFKEFLEKIRVISEMDSRRIREAFAECICQMSLSVTERTFNEVVPSFVQTMITDVWGPVQVAGFGLLAKMPSLIQMFSEDDLTEIFKVECASNAATKALIAAAHTIIDNLSSDVIELLWQTIKELTDNESLMVVSEIPRFLVKYVNKTEDLSGALEVAIGLLKHNNWMIRCSVIMTVSELFANDRASGDNIVDLLLTTLSDPVDEVHTAVAEQLAFVATTTITDTENLKKLLQTLAKAPGSNARTSLANNVTLFYEMVPIEVITVILIDLVGDTSRQVKIAAIKALSKPQIPRDVTIECVEKLAETTAEWRERRDIASVMPLILTDDMDGTEIKKLIRMFLLDPAFETRETMIQKLPQLISKFGGNWKQDVLIPILYDAIKDDDYNMRQMVVRTIAELGDWSEQELDLVKIASDDAVANVRLVVAKFIPRSYTEILNKLKEDADEDVRELANKV